MYVRKGDQYIGWFCVLIYQRINTVDDYARPLRSG